jgi:hypothetical protein
MSVDQTRDRIVARIWQSIASSGVSLDVLPRDQQDSLVNAIADGILVAVDDALEDAGVAARQANGPASPTEEQVLWEGRPFFSLATFYRITSERIRIVTGLIGRDYEDIELVRIQDIDRDQGPVQRMLNIGDIDIHSADPSRSRIRLARVRNPGQVNEILRRAMLDARKRFRYSVQEEM